MRGKVQQIARDIQDGKPITFGGEYQFLATDRYDQAFVKLDRIARQIGGIVKGKGTSIEVYPAGSGSFWSFEWIRRDEGVRHIHYWTAETVSDDLWNEEAAKLMKLIIG